jgi:hypothetical protein
MSRIATAKSETRSNVTSRKTRRSMARAKSSSAFISSLPSGESLAEFALRFGFLAPSLLGKREKKLGRLREIL